RRPSPRPASWSPRSATAPPRPLLVLLGAFALLALLAATALPGMPLGAVSGAVRLAAGLGVVGVGAVLLGSPLAPRGAGGPVLAGLLVAAMGADLLAYSLPRLYGTYYPPQAVYEAPLAARWLQDRQVAARLRGESPYRFASAVYQTEDAGEGSRLQDNRRLAFLPPNTSALYPGIDAAQGYLAIRRRETGDLFGAVNDLGRGARTLSVYDPRSRLLDLIGVRYFVTDDASTFASLVGGGRSLTAGGPPATVPVREPLPTAAVELQSRLEGTAGLAPDQVVGRLTVHGTGGETWELPVPAGAQGRARFDLTPLGLPAVQELRLEAVDPRVRWNVERVLLHTPFGARFRPALADGNLRIWENPEALPRAWWVGQYTQADDGGAALELIREGAVDPAATAVLTAPVPGMAPVSGTAPGAERRRPLPVALVSETANTRRYDVIAPAEGLLVVSEAAAPGWRATVDGRPASLYTANGGLQAVAVPAGRHQVALRYLPQSVVLGAGISGAAWALLLGWALILWGASRWALGHRPGHEAERGRDGGRRREPPGAVDVDGGGGPPGPVEEGRVAAFRA
ncbi:MAG TPA: YfhO family protein, partial [Chloroflexota bacterium]|nr:YfhO family protein [Chloroflexota bacterium]